MNQISPLKLMLVVLFSSLLTACEYDGDSIGGGGDGDTGNALPTITLTLVDAQGNALTQINGDEQGTARAVVRNKRGAAVTGNLVNFSVSIGLLAGNGAAVTDTSGVATIIVTAGTSAGAGSVAASTTVEEDGQFFNIASDSASFATDGQGSATDPVNLQVTLTLTPMTISQSSPGTVRLTLTDDAIPVPNPIPNAIVTFTSSVTSTGGVLGTSAMFTDAGGVAITSLTAGSSAGAGTLNASVEIGNETIFADPVSFITEGDEIIDTAINLTLNFSDATPGSAGNIITHSEPGTLSILVEDTSSNTLANRTANIISTLGVLAPITCPEDEAEGTDTLTAVSDANGRISVKVCGYSTIGTGDITVAVGETSESVQFDVGVDGLLIGNLLGTDIEDERIEIVDLVGDTLGFVDITQEVVVENTLAVPETLVEDTDYALNADGSGITCIVTSLKCIERADLTISYANLTPGLLAGEMALTVNPLSAFGVSDVTVSVVDQSENPIADIDINFTSNCAQEIDQDTSEPLALINDKVTTDSAGRAVATYQANGCVDKDVITATETSSGATASATIEVLPAIIGSIKFDSVVVDPEDLTVTSIQIKESGGIDRGDVIFQVLDVFGRPAPALKVQFELESNVGGLDLVNDEGFTAADGRVSATVVAGFIPTTVRVRASLDVDTDEDGIPDTTLKTLSERLTVNTGIPDQNSMSISTTVQNLEGNSLDGLTTNITVRMSDAFENPVADGTAVTFRTELGSIKPECTTIDGACAVVLTTQNPRTPLNPNVSFKTLGDGCPAARITDESLTISGSAGESNYKLKITANVVVQNAADAYLTEGLAGDYTIDTDGGGITCRPGSVSCVDAATLQITYDRLWLDEDPYDVVEEPIIISAGLVGLTLETVDMDTAVVVVDDTGRTLVQGVDYTVAATGITCIGTSTECIDSAALTISYDKIFAATDKIHPISNPGVATLPFTNVTWVPCRAAFRPATETAPGYNSGLGQPYGARSSVLAYALGEESFIDTNGNGLYDFGEPFVDLPEAFLDKNEDSVFDNGTPGVDDSRDLLVNPFCYGPSSPVTDPDEVLNACYQDGGEEETFIDFGTIPNNQYDAGNLIYNGTLCPKDISDRTVICDALPCEEDTERYCTRDLVNIRREIDILLSGSGAVFGRRDGVGELVTNFDITTGDVLGFNEYTAGSTVLANDGSIIPAGTPFTIGDAESATEVSPGIGELVNLLAGSSVIVVDIADRYNAYLPATATISVASGTDGCVIQNAPGGVVGNTGGLGFTQIGISVGPPTAPPAGGAPITITVTTIDGVVVSQTTVNCFY